MTTPEATKASEATELLVCLEGRGHQHVWAPCTVTAEDLAADPETTPEETAIVHCLRTYGMYCKPFIVRDQCGKRVSR